MTEHVEHLLSEYMDDELNELEKHKVEEHMMICSHCQNRLLEKTSLREDILSAYLQIEIPAIEDQIIKKIHQASLKRSSGMLNLLAIIALFVFGLMLFVTTSPFLTIGLPIFHTMFSIARGLIYAVPSIISAIPYVVEVIIALILCFIAISIFTLRYLVHTMGKTVRVEDI